MPTETDQAPASLLGADDRRLIGLISANRDSDVFADADRFDIGREGQPRHLGLGSGSHFCIGAALARLELKVTLEEMTSSMPDLRLVEDRELTWVNNVSFCGPRSLWLQRGR